MTLYNCNTPVTSTLEENGQTFVISHGLKWIVGGILLTKKKTFYAVYKMTSPPSPLISIREMEDMVWLTPPAVIPDLEYEATITPQQLEQYERAGHLELYASRKPPITPDLVKK